MLRGKTVAVDSTPLKTRAAMKSIVRRDIGEDWLEFLTRLMREEGVIDEDDQPTDEKPRAMAQKKKVSNAVSQSPTDDDALVLRLKNGYTHMGYRAECVVDVDSDAILRPRGLHGMDSDLWLLVDAANGVRQNLEHANCETTVEEVTTGRSYHFHDTLAGCVEPDQRTYIPEPKSRRHPHRSDTPEEVHWAALNNRRRTQRAKGRGLQRKRSEMVERSFAQVCNAGGMRGCGPGEEHAAIPPGAQPLAGDAEAARHRPAPQPAERIGMQVCASFWSPCSLAGDPGLPGGYSGHQNHTSLPRPISSCPAAPSDESRSVPRAAREPVPAGHPGRIDAAQHPRCLTRNL